MIIHTNCTVHSRKADRLVTCIAALSLCVPLETISAHQLPTQSRAAPIATTGMIPTQEERATPPVSVYVYLADLVEVASAQQTFVADVFLVERWTDPTLAGDYPRVRTLNLQDIWHPVLLVVNERDVRRSLHEVVNVDPEGNVQHTVRLTGSFSAAMNLQDFPLDRQQFNVWIVAPPLGGTEIELIPDTSVAVLRNERLSISDWTVGEPALVALDYTTTPSAIPFRGVALVIDLKRDIGYYIIQVLIPLVAIVCMAWIVFWIEPKIVNVRLGVVVNTMLTLIAYRFMLGNLVPRLSYLTRLDYFMLGVTIMVILTLFTMAATSYLIRHERDEIVRRIDVTGRVVFPLVLVALTSLIWLG